MECAFFFANLEDGFQFLVAQPLPCMQVRRRDQIDQGGAEGLQPVAHPVQQR